MIDRRNIHLQNHGVSLTENHVKWLFDDYTHISEWRLSRQDHRVFCSSKLKERLFLQEDQDTISLSEWLLLWKTEDQKTFNDFLGNDQQAFKMLHHIKPNNDKPLWFFTELIQTTEKEYVFASACVDELVEELQALNVDKSIYNTFIHSIRGATWIWDIETGETIFDELWASFLGRNLKDLEPTTIKTWEMLTHPDDLKQAYNDVNKVLQKEKEFYITNFRMLHQNGHYVWINDRGKVVSWTAEGKPKLMVGVHIDITEQKELEDKLVKREKHFKHLVESSYDIVYTLDLEGRMTYLSPAWESLLGYQVEHVINQSFKPYAHPDDIDRLLGFFNNLKASKSRLAIEEYRLRKSDGEYRWFNTNAIALLDENDNIIGFSGTARDITKRKNLELELSYDRDLFKKTLLSVGDAVVSTDNDGFINLFNPNAQHILGWQETDIKGRHIADVLRLYYEDEFGNAKSIVELLSVKQICYIQHATIINKVGRQLYIELSLSPIQDHEGNIDGSVIIFRDISEKIRKQKEIEFLSYHDYLTGLYNRRYMDQAVLDLDKDRYLPLGAFMIDVNQLKEMNDSHGHQVGDELLKKVSRVLESNIDQKDLLGRMGGDEFLILMPNTTPERLYDYKNRILAAFSKESIKGESISVALGYSIKDDANQDIYDVIKEADNYMYANKEQQNNTKG